MLTDTGPFREARDRFGFTPLTDVVAGEGTLNRLGEFARQLGFRRAMLVADRGLVAAGYVSRAQSLLEASGVAVVPFHDFDANPDTRMVETGRAVAAASDIDAIVALGGGSSLDCAKGINFVLTNGGTMRDYWGFGKATRPMLPSLGIPTTAGTGSEAQSYALISDADTHVKMACGDHQAAFRLAFLDPALTLTQPRAVTAVTGFDALSHAVESHVTTKRTDVSALFSLDAWRLLNANFARVLETPGDLGARAAMLLGAHEAGIAIEASMLGATHACANPLTARYGTVHGVAIGVMLPHVVRWNAAHCEQGYRELVAGMNGAVISPGASSAGHLASTLDALARVAGLPATLRALGVLREDLPALAADAGKQWTGTFNPRPFDAAGALELYTNAY